MKDQPKNLREQLSPMAAKLRASRSSTRPVSQVVLRLVKVGAEDRFSQAIDAALNWMNRRAGRRLPDEAWARKSFELADIGAQRVAAVRLNEPEFWSARIDDADKTVPMRIWTTEIGVVRESPESVLLGVRLICSTRGEDVPYRRSVQGFVREVLTKGKAELDGRQVQRTPWLIEDEKDVHELVRLLERPGRLTDVVVLSLPEGSSDGGQAACSASRLADLLFGAAHVAVLTGPASYFLTDAVGRELSVFHRAVRIYRPRFRAWLDDPYRHPLSFPQRIEAWNEVGSAAFEEWLVEEVLANGVRHPDREELVPSFTTVRQLATHQAISRAQAAGGDSAGVLALFEADNAALRRELTEQKQNWEGLLKEAELEREAAIDEVNRLKAQSFDRLHRIKELEQRVREVGSQRQTPIPDRLDDLEQWCKEHLVGHVEVMNRAFQGARKSVYQDPSLVYRSLLLLRDHYVPMRIEPSTERREKYLAELAALQLEESQTGEQAERGADGYVVQYGAERRPLDIHLKKGNSRDPRFCFRLYFFWDEVGETAVVGWLPSHLDNRLT